jgi:hypothetical protein
MTVQPIALRVVLLRFDIDRYDWHKHGWFFRV